MLWNPISVTRSLIRPIEEGMSRTFETIARSNVRRGSNCKQVNREQVNRERGGNLLAGDACRFRCQHQLMHRDVTACLMVAFATFLSGCESRETNRTDSTAKNSKENVEVSTGERSSSAKPEIRQPLNQQRKFPDSLVIGLDADMSSAAAQSGLAIQRGIMLAIDQINQSGGLLEQPVELVVRDHRGNPDRGVDNIAEFAAMPDVLAVVGGLHTPVALRELKTIHDHKMIYLGPWAAGTPIVDNGYTPNYVFRVSVRDEYAGGFLVDRALERGLDKIGVLLERTGWGRSNQLAMQNALQARGSKPVRVEWFNIGEKNLSEQLQRLLDSGSECVLLVCNPLEGKVAIDAMAAREAADRIPIISHWGITGTNFFKMTEENLKLIDLSFLQTRSFLQPKNVEGINRLYEAYTARFGDCQSWGDVRSAVGTVHAYEVTMMLAAAVKAANSDNRVEIRDALESLEKHDGAMREYDRPFEQGNHDALTEDDLILARFGEHGIIEAFLPVSDGSTADEVADD